MKFTAALVALTVSAIAIAQEPRPAPQILPSFTTTHVSDSNWHFIFPAGQAVAYYADARLGLKIESVYVDGVVLSPDISESLSGHISDHVYTPAVPTSFVYRLPQAQFMFVVSRAQNGRMKVGRYEIPGDAKKIEVSYRVRYPNGRLSAECLLTSYEASAFVPRE